MPVSGAFHPAVEAWFTGRFPAGPSEPQRRGWPAIRSGADTLIAAPTGSGKTLSGFLVAIDALYHSYDSPDASESGGRTRVVYVSPLKALAVDVHVNLERPLDGIAAAAHSLGLPAAPVTAGVRTGDTTSSQRRALVKNPPDILVTTPESLYLMLTSESGRDTLHAVETVIVDEIHALARDKRGSHLALSLERLDALAQGRPPQRIGLSATQRPIETIASLLVGTARPSPTIVDCGHARGVSIEMRLPRTELSAVASQEQSSDMLDAIAQEVRAHRTTLVFVNTRRMSERVAHSLVERLGDDAVSAHHGSLSKDRRQRVEARLRAGELRCLVATASLELGIDVGPVELVCQIGSPRSIATFLQRVGRSNHSLDGVPRGLLFPLTRDELVECTALFAALRGGRLDAVVPARAPLDILAQQIVAEVAAAEWKEDDLFDLVRRAAPYGDLSRADFDDVVAMVSDGIMTGRGRRAAYIHRDSVNGILRPRRGARIAAATSGGAIPEVGDYRVVLDPDETFVGTVNEDFAIESMVGDVFLLGTHSWQIRQVTQGTVRVSDAGGAHPTIPFWLGEAPSRTTELSEEVSALRAGVGERLESSHPDTGSAESFVIDTCGVGSDAARQIVAYLAAARGALGTIPTTDHIVFERFFDEAGGMQLVVHAPFGGRVNRGFGLALRKRFCATFDFELQAAASDDAVVLSLGPQHSFPAEHAGKLLRAHSVEEVLTQAVLASPMFGARWRWNLNRSLVVLRQRGGSRNPLPIQRMESDDLMAVVFPALAACQENAPAGPIPIPDHLLVRQTLHDCLHEAMDVDALRSVLSSMEDGSIAMSFVDSPEPSVLSHEILNGRPYTFLDDAPLEERRTRAVQLRRSLPVSAEELGALDPAAIARVRSEVAPDPRDAEELHDLLLSLVVLRPEAKWQAWFDELSHTRRVCTIRVEGADLWCAAERRDVAEAAFDQDEDSACGDIVSGHLDVSGPVTVEELSRVTALAPGRVRSALGLLEAHGFALRGSFERTGDSVSPSPEQWCARRLLARIHGYTRKSLRNEIQPVALQDFTRFLLGWQRATPETRAGRRGLVSVIDQLQGFEVPAGAWEEAILATRVEGYRSDWLDDLCLAGDVVWGRFAVGPEDPEQPARRGARSPSRSTPITFALREDMGWLLSAARAGLPSIVPPDRGASHDLHAALGERGALFHSELREVTQRLPVEVEEGLWDLVARGIATADGFHAVRSLLSSRETWQRRQRHVRRAAGGARSAARRLGAPVAGRAEGRWTLLPGAEDAVALDPDVLAESVAEQLLVRWGVVFYGIAARERFAVPWREILWALRRMEARGTVRGGRFVSGVTGEQFALPHAVDGLRAVRRAPRTGQVVRINAADPLNLVGTVLSGVRVPAVRTNWITYVDGLAVTPEDAVSAR